MKSRAGGGTSIPEPRSFAWLVALLVVAPLGTFITHRVSSGTTCGWDYGNVGGACRAIILLSILAGLAAGVLAAVGARGNVREHKERAAMFLVFAAIVVAGATWFAKGFQDYRMGSSNWGEMDEETCRLVREKMPVCIEERYGERGRDHAAHLRQAIERDGCIADDRSIAEYEQCIRLPDCNQIMECLLR